MSIARHAIEREPVPITPAGKSILSTAALKPLFAFLQFSTLPALHVLRSLAGNSGHEFRFLFVQPCTVLSRVFSCHGLYNGVVDIYLQAFVATSFPKCLWLDQVRRFRPNLVNLDQVWPISTGFGPYDWPNLGRVRPSWTGSDHTWAVPSAECMRGLTSTNEGPLSTNVGPSPTNQRPR